MNVVLFFIRVCIQVLYLCLKELVSFEREREREREREMTRRMYFLWHI